MTSLIALALATPISIAIALFLTEIAPKKVAAPIATMVELLAAIPSVVLGLWGILVFGPWVGDHLEPAQGHAPLHPRVLGRAVAGGVLPAALVLTIMVVPITSAICRELFLRVPRDLTDGALALGSTRWESIRGVMLSYAAPGIVAAAAGLGRAFGEAIAVSQTIGNHNAIPTSWFEPGDSLGSKVASEYVGATSLEQASSILYLAAILMVISLVTNVVAQVVVVRFERARRADERRADHGRPVRHHGSLQRATAPPDHRKNLRHSLAFLAALLACGILALVLGTLVYKGASQLSLDFFTKPRPLFGEKGGIADALVGTALIVGMAMLMAIPVAVLVAIYMAEYAGPRVSRGLRIVLDVLNGVPAIVVGVFVFGLLVVGHGQSAVYGAFALAILMLPMVARATQEILQVVPQSLRHASLALGVTKWRTTWNVILPAAIGGILTGVVIAVARIAGETAPLLFTSSIAANAVSVDIHGALPTLPVTIYVNSESPDPGEQASAWAAALVLIAFVLVMNVLAKVFAGRKRRQLEGS